MNDQNTEDPTFGEKTIRVSFNPSNNPKVDAIKSKAAAFIDEVCGPNQERLDFKANRGPEVAALRKLAQRAAEEAAFWAVKAETEGGAQ